MFPPARSALAVLSVSCALLAPGCRGVRMERTNPSIPVTSSSAVLHAGDSLVISLQSIPDPSTNNVTVDEQGLVALPFIGSVGAAGINPSELQQRIRETYIARKFYTSIDVSVNVSERYIIVGGEVAHPGRIVWSVDLTAAKAIQAAGGFTLYAKETDVSLVRDNRPYSIDVKLAQKNPTQDPRLMPGDSLQVRRSPF